MLVIHTKGFGDIGLCRVLWASVACAFLLYYRPHIFTWRRDPPRSTFRLRCFPTLRLTSLLAAINKACIRSVSRRVRTPHASSTIARVAVVVDMVSHRKIRWEKDLSVFEYNPRRRSVCFFCCRTAFAISLRRRAAPRLNTP